MQNFKVGSIATTNLLGNYEFPEKFKFLSSIHLQMRISNGITFNQTWPWSKMTAHNRQIYFVSIIYFACNLFCMQMDTTCKKVLRGTCVQRNTGLWYILLMLSL